MTVAVNSVVRATQLWIGTFAIELQGELGERAEAVSRIDQGASVGVVAVQDDVAVPPARAFLILHPVLHGLGGGGLPERDDLTSLPVVSRLHERTHPWVNGILCRRRPGDRATRRGVPVAVELLV